MGRMECVVWPMVWVMTAKGIKRNARNLHIVLHLIDRSAVATRKIAVRGKSKFVSDAT